MITDKLNYSTICEADEYVGSIKYVNHAEHKIAKADIYVFINRLGVQQVCVQHKDSVRYFNISVAILGKFEGQYAVRELLLEKGTLTWKG